MTMTQQTTDDTTEKQDKLPKIWAADLKNWDEFSDNGHHANHTVYFGENYVWAITGVRGSGKSCFMAAMITLALYQGVKVWSNLPVKFLLVNEDNTSKVCSSMPLDLNALYALSSDLESGLVCIDEVQYYAYNRSSQSLNNKLLNVVMMQIRKRALDVAMTLQDFGWVDKQVRFQVDIEVQCKDYSKTPSGMGVDAGRGELFLLDLYDHSGAWTGVPVRDAPERYPMKKTFHGKKFWDVYNTKTVIDYFDVMTPIQVDMDRRVIGDRAVKRQRAIDQLEVVALDFVAQGKHHVTTQEFWTTAFREYGIEGDQRNLGPELTKLGVEKKRKRSGDEYDLTKLQLGA